MKALLRLLLTILFLPALHLAAGDITLNQPAAAGPWRPLEFEIGNVPASANPFDPEIIRLDAVITSPSGQAVTVPAFWTQDFTSALVNGEEHTRASGTGGWRLRFTPTEPGEHRLALQIADGGGGPRIVLSRAFGVPDVKPVGQHGWVRVAADHRYLETSDGQALRLIGENVCWPQRGGTFDYEAWFEKLRTSGQNFARLWMCPWWLPLEQGKDSRTRYDMDAAWRLDRIFQIAEAKGIYLLLCLDFHGMYQVDNPHWGGSGNWWTRNPYHKDQGGPGVHPNDFFTSNEARKIYQKRLRYLIARYGANPRLLAWQFFNEIDNVYAPHLLQAADVAAWHRDMGAWLKAQDPYRHLVTTSLTGGSDRAEIWSLKEMDFASYHSYGDPAPAKSLAARSEDYFRRYQKPTLIGEYGTDWRGWGGRTTDPHLRGQRQALWGAALGGSMGPALSWWWEEIDLDNVYPIYQAMSSVLGRAGWHQGNWTPAAVRPAAETAPKQVGEMRPGGAVITSYLTMNNVSWLNLDGAAAITGQLATERASESISNYLGGTNQGPRQRPMRLDAWWAGGASLSIKVTELGGDAELRVKVDGAEVFRTPLKLTTPLNGKSAPTEQEFSVPIPAGRHLVELENPGKEWLFIGSLRLHGVRESSFPGGWDFPPEVQAMRQADRALLYVVSPWAVYPAGSQKYAPPVQQATRLSLADWPSGVFLARWFDPATGRELAATRHASSGGALELTAPDFTVDLAAIIMREP